MACQVIFKRVHQLTSASRFRITGNSDSSKKRFVRKPPVQRQPVMKLNSGPGTGGREQETWVPYAQTAFGNPEPPEHS
jgi:hypothetical protein